MARGLSSLLKGKSKAKKATQMRQCPKQYQESWICSLITDLFEAREDKQCTLESRALTKLLEDIELMGNTFQELN